MPWREDGILIKKNEQRSGEDVVAHQNSTTDMHHAGPAGACPADTWVNYLPGGRNCSSIQP